MVVKSTANQTRTVALVCSKQLFSEILRNLLAGEEDIHLLGPWDYSDKVLEQLKQGRPDLVVVAVDSEPPIKDITHLVAQILETFPQMALVRISLSKNEDDPEHRLRIYTTYSLPARSLDFLNLVRNLPVEANPFASLHALTSKTA